MTGNKCYLFHEVVSTAADMQLNSSAIKYIIYLISFYVVDVVTIYKLQHNLDDLCL